MHGIDYKNKIENLIIEKRILQMKIEQNERLEGIFSPVNICVAIASIMLLGSLLQSLNIF
jgi:hypothetical protein